MFPLTEPAFSFALMAPTVNSPPVYQAICVTERQTKFATVEMPPGIILRAS